MCIGKLFSGREQVMLLLLTIAMDMVHGTVPTTHQYDPASLSSLVVTYQPSSEGLHEFGNKCNLNFYTFLF